MLQKESVKQCHSFAEMLRKKWMANKAATHTHGVMGMIHFLGFTFILCQVFQGPPSTQYVVYCWVRNQARI